MNVTLLAVNTKYVHSSLAAWYLASGIATHCRQEHAVKIVEATINQSSEQIAALVIAQNPDVIGISTYIWNASLLPELCVRLRHGLPKAKIVLGGPEAAHNAAHWLERGADYVLRGPGEHRFAALLDALAEDNTTIIDTTKTVDPYSSDYFHALGGRIAYIETSRGCPFRCAYCLSGESELRFIPLRAAKEQIAKLAFSGTRTIKFVDRTFNANLQRACEIWEYSLALGSDCRFHFEVAADLFDEKSMSLLSRAAPGRIQLEIGLQSFHEPALAAVRRKTDLTKVEKNIRRLLAPGNIHVHVDLIAGLPYETLAAFEQSFRRAYALGAHTLQLGFLKLLHGSKLRSDAESLGLVYHKTPPYEIIRNPWMSESDFRYLKIAENALQHTYNQGRFLSTLDYVLSASQLSPLCLFRETGEAAFHEATPLDTYAAQLYQYFVSLPNVKAELLRDRMLCDFLRMTKGNSMPAFLKGHGKKQRQAVEFANEALARSICAKEAAVLSTGKGVYADSQKQNPVTGLYPLYFFDL